MIKKLFLIVSLATTVNFAHADEWTGSDKNKHFIAGAVAASAITYYTKDETRGFMYGAAIGLAKEIYDAAGNGDPSFKDFAVTALGAFVGAKITGLYIVPQKDGVFVGYNTKF